MHVHIATVGYQPEPVKKAFNAIPGIDKVYLLCGEKFHEKGEELVSFFENGMAKAELVLINGFNFNEIIQNIYRIYHMNKGRKTEFSINITGGTNLMAAAACSSAFFIGAKIYYVSWDDNKSLSEQLVEIPTPHTPNLDSLKPFTKDVLKFIYEEDCNGSIITNSTISNHFGRVKQNISYHVKRLKDEGLITAERGVIEDGKVLNNLVSLNLTDQGRLIASWLNYD